MNVTEYSQLNELPEQLDAQQSVTLGNLSLRKVTRYLQGRRLSGIGCWNNSPAFIKLFFASNGAKQEYEREKNAATALARHNISTPALLASGDNSGVYWLVFELLNAPQDYGHFWQDARRSDNDNHASYFVDLLNLCATLYRAKLIQTDPHLENFVVNDNRIYVVDAGGIKATKTVSVRKCLANLGLLIAQFPQPDHSQLLTTTDVWLGEHDDIFGSVSKKQFENIFLKQFRHRLRRYEKKVVRSCTQIKCHKSKQLRLLCQRDSYQQLYHELTPEILDQKILAAPLLKDGNTATVASITIAGRELIVKRYNYLGRFSAWRRSLLPSRAQRSWVGGHLLQDLHLHTPAPIAMLEELNRYGVRRAYLVSEHVAGETAYDYYHQTETPNPLILERFEQVINALCAARISHGDMKATNFLVADTTLNVIDLDSIVFHNNDKSFKKALQNDIKRLLQNWQDLPVIHQKFAELCHRCSKK